MGIFSAKNYKLAKIFCDDLEVVLKIINLSLRGLEPFKHYKPVARILQSLKQEQTILQSHYEKYKEIKKNKGKLK